MRLRQGVLIAGIMLVSSFSLANTFNIQPRGIHNRSPAAEKIRRDVDPAKAKANTTSAQSPKQENPEKELLRKNLVSGAVLVVTSTKCMLELHAQTKGQSNIKEISGTLTFIDFSGKNELIATAQVSPEQDTLYLIMQNGQIKVLDFKTSLLDTYDESDLSSVIRSCGPGILSCVASTGWVGVACAEPPFVVWMRARNTDAATGRELEYQDPKSFSGKADGGPMLLENGESRCILSAEPTN